MVAAHRLGRRPGRRCRRRAVPRPRRPAPAGRSRPPRSASRTASGSDLAARPPDLVAHERLASPGLVIFGHVDDVRAAVAQRADQVLGRLARRRPRAARPAARCPPARLTYAGDRRGDVLARLVRALQHDHPPLGEQRRADQLGQLRRGAGRSPSPGSARRPGRRACAASTAARTARSTSSSSSPRTSCSAGGVTAGAFTRPSSHHGADIASSRLASTPVESRLGLSNDGPHIGRRPGSCRNVSGRQLNIAHPEGQRERPEEAPATGVSHVAFRENGDDHGANSDPHAGKMRRYLAMTITADAGHDHARPRARARPDLSGVRQPDPARRRVRVCRVFRPARGRLRLRRHHPRGDRGRPQVDLALPPAAARAVRCGRAPEHRSRPHPPGEGRPAGAPRSA